MRVQQVDTENRIFSVVSAIDVDPASWKGWLALHVHAVDAQDDDFRDVAIAARAMIESYLKDAEGTAYFCNDRDIYVICKNVTRDVLEQMARQIEALVFAENYLSCAYRLYDLGTEARAFAQAVFNKADERLSVHLSGEADEDEKDAQRQDDGARSGRASKVLLVEDDAVIRWMVQKALEGECEISSADTANKAFTLYTAQNPDIVLLDIGLPDNNGKAVLEWIMRNDPAACVVMLSGRGNIDNIAGCMETGAKGFISKPFVKQDLMHYIRKYG